MDNEVVMTLVYGLAKFFAYSGWCHVGLRSVTASSGIGPALRLGGVRWLLGLCFGLVVFFSVGSIDPDVAARTYFLIYSPLRLVEWGIMAVIIGRRAPGTPGSMRMLPLVAWCVGGILVSFLTDLLSPEGLQGRFCVGRCLC